MTVNYIKEKKTFLLALLFATVAINQATASDEEAPRLGNDETAIIQQKLAELAAQERVVRHTCPAVEKVQQALANNEQSLTVGGLTFQVKPTTPYNGAPVTFKHATLINFSSNEIGCIYSGATLEIKHPRSAQCKFTGYGRVAEAGRHTGLLVPVYYADAPEGIEVTCNLKVSEEKKKLDNQQHMYAGQLSKYAEKK